MQESMKKTHAMLQIKDIEFKELNIPFNTAFTHASASRHSTQTIWVKITTTCGLTGYGEGCPREYVTGESLESALRFIADQKKVVLEDIHDLSTLTDWVNENEKLIDSNPAAWCAIELALLDIIAQNEYCSIENLLDVPIIRESFTYTAVLGNNKFSAFKRQALQYKKLGFLDFKIKLSGNLKEDTEKLDFLSKSHSAVRIRVDANNLWKNKDEVVEYVCELNSPIFAIEEPIDPEQYEDLQAISRSLAIPIILDESLRRRSQLDYVKKNPSNWILNVRVSKMGGLIRSLKVIQEARKHRLPLIVGAHVGETSLLTRAGFVIAQAAHDSLLAHEGGFGRYLLKEDVCDESLMFGRNGKIQYSLDKLSSPGFGLAINS